VNQISERPNSTRRKSSDSYQFTRVQSSIETSRSAHRDLQLKF